jgi:hypothetical protein
MDSDIALIGTGIAPLLAASHLLAQGKSVLLLNPDRDFFLEDSELPFDPLLQGTHFSQRLLRNSPEKALMTLRPDYPGAIEYWSGESKPEGYHDPTAPHVRQRHRLWISSSEYNRLWTWETLEDLYVEASDAGLNPQILEGFSAARRFPGFSGKDGSERGLLIPRVSDIDVLRYRNGLLEFIRERLGPERMISAAKQIQCMPEGIRFHSNKSHQTAKIGEGILAFWTPHMTPWVMNQAKINEIDPVLPEGLRLWEQWSLNSRDTPDPNTIGMIGDMIVWSDFEGLPSENSPYLSILRSGPLLRMNKAQTGSTLSGWDWASAESFAALSKLCHGFLKWDRFSIRNLRTRSLFDWKNDESWLLSKGDPIIRIVTACDGPLVDIVHVVRAACEKVLK